MSADKNAPTLQVVALGAQSAMAILLVARLCLGAFLFTSSIRKLADLPKFIEGTVAYDVVPKRAARIIGLTVPWIELALAIALILGVTLPVAGALAALLLASFALAVAINLRRGRKINCNCYGIAETVTISLATVARACMLLAIAITVAVVSGELVPIDRWLSPWSGDGATVASATTALILILVIACCIVLVYLVEWTLDLYGRLADLGTERNLTKNEASAATTAGSVRVADLQGADMQASPLPNGSRPVERLRFRSEDMRKS